MERRVPIPCHPGDAIAIDVPYFDQIGDDEATRQPRVIPPETTWLAQIRHPNTLALHCTLTGVLLDGDDGNFARFHAPGSETGLIRRGDLVDAQDLLIDLTILRGVCDCDVDAAFVEP